MILMPQLLYVLHNSLVVIPLKIFHIMNTIFRSLLWLSKNPGRKVQECWGLALPNPLFYCLASQMQHIAHSMSSGPGMVERDRDHSTWLLVHTVEIERTKSGLEGLAFCKSNKLYPTYAHMQKTWNKVRQLQQIMGFTGFSPIWGNEYYPELVKLKYGARWQLFGVTHLRHIFANRRLCSFLNLQERVSSPGLDAILLYAASPCGKSTGRAWSINTITIPNI